MQSRLVLSAGMIGAGKSTTCKELARMLPNGFYLDRDDVLYGLLHVAPTKTKELPSFEDYVANDQVFPDNARNVQTPFGDMIQVFPLNAFNRRHGRDQSYIVQARLAQVGLSLGKVPILDCFLVRQFDDGTLTKFLNWEVFDNYPKYLIWFAVNPQICWERITKRASADKEAEKRSAEFLKDWDSFEKKLEAKHPFRPASLDGFKHLFLDTSNLTTEDCVRICMEYISSPGNAI